MLDLYCWELCNKILRLVQTNREIQIIRKGRSKLAGQERKKDTKMTEELMLPSEHDTL